jgi:hypothetical protein
VGDKDAPKFEKGVTLVEKFDGHGYNLLRWSDDEIVPGIRSQIDVIDHNGDGKLDLILGDFSTAYEPRTNLSDEEKEQFKSLLAELEASSKPFGEKMKALREDFAKRHPGDAAFTPEANEEWSKAYQALREGPETKQMEAIEGELVRQIRPYLAKTYGDGDESFYLAIPHGYVWLFVRK